MATTESTSLWVILVPLIAAGFFGGGGLVAFLKTRDDAKKGIRQESRADVDSLNARAVAIVESQFQYLVKPLQDKVDGLDKKVEYLSKEVEVQKNRYWTAIRLIRKLYTWITVNYPDRNDVPQPSSDLAKDI